MIRFGGVLLVAALAVVLSTAPANATVFVTDDFNAYSLGDLVPQGGWFAHSGAGNLPVQVVPSPPCFLEPSGAGNAVQLVQGGGSREDVGIALGDVMEAGDKWYAGFCVVVTADGPLAGTDDEYFAHFKTSGTYYGAKVAVMPADGYDFTFSLEGDNIDPYPGGFALGTCHRVVTAYDFDSGISEMWIDPDCTLAEDDPLQVPSILIQSYAGNAYEAYALRQSDASNPDPTQTVDNLDVATTFAEVCGVCIPEPSTLALLALSGLALLRRR